MKVLKLFSGVGLLTLSLTTQANAQWQALLGDLGEQVIVDQVIGLLGSIIGETDVKGEVGLGHWHRVFNYVHYGPVRPDGDKTPVIRATTETWDVTRIAATGDHAYSYQFVDNLQSQRLCIFNIK